MFWRRLYNKELNSLYHSLNIVRMNKSKRLRWGSHVARIEEGKSTFQILTSKPTGKKTFGIPRGRSEANIRIDCK